MSMQTREWVAGHPHMFYQHASQKSDILNPVITQTQLISALQHLLINGWILEITAIVSDHHDDTGVCFPPYFGTHAHGWSVDLWPLKVAAPEQYYDASDPHFQKFLTYCANLPNLMQVGLGGSSDSCIDEIAAGPTWFKDSVADHVHIGCKA